MDPREEYKARLKVRLETVDSLRRLDHRVAALRLAAAIAFFAMIWLAWGSGVFSGWWSLLPLGAFITLVGYHEHVYRLGRRAYRAVVFYERGLARIEDRWQGSGNTRVVVLDDAHSYTADLDVFGPGSLFELLSNARTTAGEEKLGRWLCAPASRPEILRRQDAVEELRNNLDLREDLAVLGEEVQKAIHPDSMMRWGLAPPVLKSRLAQTIAPILAAMSASTLVWYWAYEGSGLLLLVVLAAEGAFGLHYRNRVRQVIASLDQPTKELEILSLVLSRLEREHFKSEKLRELRAALDANGKSSSRQIARLMKLMQLLDSRLNMAFAAIAAILLMTTQLAFVIEAWRMRYGALIGPWLDAVGELEALCSLAGYAYEHPADPFPEILEIGPRLEGDELAHPLIPANRAVSNSVHLNRDLQLLLVSGSNMSGKSTLLRTVGVNVLLALAGAPVRARGMRLSVLRIGATIRVMDSLQAGTSRFYAEIQRLRDIMEMTKGTQPVLFLLDEILHGTNSHDRAVGAEAVVRGLIARGAIGLVTTHDLALAQVADTLAPKAANVHFEDQLVDGKMVFDYHVRPGVVQKSNALELMRAVGLDV